MTFWRCAAKGDGFRRGKLQTAVATRTTQPTKKTALEKKTADIALKNMEIKRRNKTKRWGGEKNYKRRQRPCERTH
jgi:hypothetical protein